MSLHQDVADDILLHCDRTRSREARYALERIFWQPLRKSGIELHPSCILDPEKDILLAQEYQKRHFSDGLWGCSICSKKFRTEHFLDKHLARKHPLAREANGTVCLADLCGSLIPCMPLTRSVLPSVSSAILNSSLEHPATTELEAEKKAFCLQSEMKRKRIHACTDVIHQCMRPPRHRLLGWSAQIHFERFKHELCERAIEIDCVQRENIWSTLGTPDHLLRSGSWIPLSYFLGWGCVACVLISILVWNCIRATRISARKRHVNRYLTRRRRRGQRASRHSIERRKQS